VVTIDAFNFCMQIRGNQSLLDVHDCPDDVKRLVQAATALNVDLVERQRAAIDQECGAGVYDCFNAGQMPGKGIPMSEDGCNRCGAEAYAEFGRPCQQRLIDRFGGGASTFTGTGDTRSPRSSS